ncbi:hypothetical protein QBC36DRAFT_379638 [Triangularia setosa]|uniref:Uncharacterized protein n=1 Tax=Triangularia setosa TaxID=2587417 RepID=A0AAN6W4I2_9PEZI|nr:hypothetical protein QBC36DRAFT_379638 [Podospora setosa]
MKESQMRRGPASSLRYYGTAAVIAVSYLALLIMPWVLTCILHYRPIAAGRPCYEGLPGRTASRRYPALDTNKGPQFLFAIQALNAVTTLVSIPVILALLARAAVVYSQRRTSKQTLNARQLFTLADGGWLTGVYTPLSIFAVSLLAMAVTLPLVRSLIVSTETIAVANSTSGNILDMPGYLIAHDVDPAELAMVGQYDAVGKTRSRLLSTSFIQAEPHVWDVEHYQLAVTNIRGSVQPGRYFVSKIPIGTNTGMIRAHALRLNSSAPVCTHIPEEDFPSPCPGPKPFVTSMATNGGFPYEDFFVNICVPGNQSASWDRQEITEQLYLQVKNSELISHLQNYTMVCTVNTTRGFFELPNFHNGLAPGPLVDFVPSNGELMAPLNSWWYDFPAQNLSEPWKTSGKTSTWRQSPKTLEEIRSGTVVAPGPLSISAQALFGPGSFFHEARRLSIDSNATWWNAYRTMCTGTGIPFVEELMLRPGSGSCIEVGVDGKFMDESRAARQVVGLLRVFFNRLFTPSSSEIDTAISFANEAVLTIWPYSSFSRNLVRPIFYTPKAEAVKPRIAGGIAGIAVISVLLGLQALGIIFLTLYVYSSPTWTETLDSLAIVRIANQLGSDAEPISKMPLRPIGGMNDKKVLEQLGTVNALIGVADHPKAVSDAEAASSTGSARAPDQRLNNLNLESETDTGYTPVLGVGAPGVINRWKARAS